MKTCVKILGISLVATLAMANSAMAEDVLVAHSPKKGLEAYAQVQGGGWCRAEVGLRVVAKDAATLKSDGFNDFMTIVGTNVLKKDCPQVVGASFVYGVAGEPSSTQYGRMVAADGWKRLDNPMPSSSQSSSTVRSEPVKAAPAAPAATETPKVVSSAPPAATGSSDTAKAEEAERAAKARMESSKTDYDRALGEVEAAKTPYEQARAAFERAKEALSQKQAAADRAKQAMDKAVGDYDVAKSSVAFAKSGIKVGQAFKDCPICPEMVIIPPGSFMMGSPEGEKERQSYEGPQHRVTIGTAFALGKAEVTQAEWEAVMGNNPSHFRGANRPVEWVSWDEVQIFIGKLNAKTGQRYRLPSEAEWEYAARAGTTTPWSCGGSEGCLSSAAVNDRNSGKQTQPVRSKSANAFGLHDMHGNVSEWVQDCWRDNYSGAPSDGSAWTGSNSCYRVLRGGAWGYYLWALRSAFRNYYPQDVRSFDLGFRLARTL
ncbi:formylglycine-generating enzyme family protein [Paramagnetospirillum magneticum]|uniref:Sulfatase modifying factor 1 n=1 Tax=Paramagnetospirillum magneticum (strain ATCC 700264 / AMB-1) TaxID=342108 RepID=Q2W6K8_PARM1|nr:formylglycine-generating enzyme family protein [Paramagnetospirillum magneticum]BAE50517.1 Sulfatase modifying factor 1 precursor [Paramagnetospirillum magneticum AMB-1]